MNDSKIAVRYAKALFGLALSRNALDSVYADMRTVNSLCSMKEVREMTENPVIPAGKRKEIILTLAGRDINVLSRDFVSLMFDHGRGDRLGAAARVFITMTRTHHGIREVTLTTAVPVTEEVKNSMAALAKDRPGVSFEFTDNIDASIIGGFILRVDDTYIDASIRNRLNRFRKEFSLAGNSEE